MREKIAEETVVIYQKEENQVMSILENQSNARFYKSVFSHLDVSEIEKTKSKKGRPSEKAGLFRSFVVMKCEKLSNAESSLISESLYLFMNK